MEKTRRLASQLAWSTAACALSCALAFGPALEIASRESPADAAARDPQEARRRRSSPLLNASALAALEHDGFVVVDEALPAALVSAARDDCARLQRAGAFRRTGQHSASVRSDLVCWLCEVVFSRSWKRPSSAIFAMWWWAMCCGVLRRARGGALILGDNCAGMKLCLMSVRGRWRGARRRRWGGLGCCGGRRRWTKR